jgi:hypothetical protein
MTLFRLAEALHKSVSEVETWSFDELSGWIAYFKIKAQDHNR